MSELMEEDVFVTEEEAGFRVTDDQTAEWCLKKIREANEEKQRWKEYYDEQLRKIYTREDSRIAFMEMKLQSYFGSVPHKQTKTQESYQLPGGKLVLKKQAPEYERDDELIIAWLKAAGKTHLVNTKEVLNWMELKRELKPVNDEQVVDSDGEIVPGLYVHERPDKFVVEVK